MPKIIGLYFPGFVFRTQIKSNLGMVRLMGRWHYSIVLSYRLQALKFQAMSALQNYI